MFEKLEAATRIDLAKAKMTRVLGHCLYVLELHANNAHVVHSPLLTFTEDSEAAPRLRHRAADPRQ
jgi:hypothetical protein